jgi:hypothetical protein
MDFVCGKQPVHGVLERGPAYPLPVQPFLLREHGREQIRLLLVA